MRILKSNRTLQSTYKGKLSNEVVPKFLACKPLLLHLIDGEHQLVFRTKKIKKIRKL